MPFARIYKFVPNISLSFYSCLSSSSTMAAANKVIDMRSDTVTTPTQKMKEAMMQAKVGDDVYGEDPTVILLQNKIAALLNKESALFFPSGTMSNLVGIMAHANTRGDEVILGDRSHIAIWEQGSISQVGGVFARQVKNLDDGTLDLDDLQSKIHKGGFDGHYCHTQAIIIENTHNYCYGSPITIDYMDKIVSIARDNDLKIHVDGARLFNAATALGVHVSELVKHANSVNVCLSKGLGAPVGSMLIGSSDFIACCHRIRKSLGGGMRQVGMLAAAGIFALDNHAPLLHVDHDNAKQLAHGLAKMVEVGASINVDYVHTNMVMFSLDRPDLSPEKFCNLLLQPINETAPIIKMIPRGCPHKIIRAVIHHQINKDDIDFTLTRIQQILKQSY